MSTSEPNNVSPQKPSSIWHRPIKVKFGALAKAVGAGAISGAFGNWEGVSSSGLGVLEALGLERKTGDIAWLLVQRSLLQAMSDLVKDYQRQLTGEANFKQLCERLDTVMEQSSFELTSDFFDRPKQLEIVGACQAPYKQWMEDSGLWERDADAISKRLPSYFVYALNDQWRSNPQDYSILQDSLKTPFMEAGDRERAWRRYLAWLQRRADEPMFAEAFSLRQIYIPLRGYYERKKKGDREAEELGISRQRIKEDKENVERVIVDLFTSLEDWVQKSDKDDAVRVICGGPGCGKSSFAKMFASRLIENNTIPLLLIPLHQFNLAADLVEAMDDFIQADLDNLLPPNPLNRDFMEQKLLIIFDGLDELVMQGKSATQAVQDFVREVLRKLQRFNGNDARVLVLMSGREVVVQNNRSEFRKEGQILHMLPYFQTQKERRQHRYHDDNKLLNQDLRQQWWKTYGQLKAKDYTGIPDELNRDNLAEITGQPLLSYLVALSYARGELDFSEDSNLNIIYADLLERIYERDWAGYQHPRLGNISREYFIRILEEIGIACWHGDGRTATLKNIENRCTSGTLKRVLEIFQGGAQEGVTRLLTAFYFRQSGTHGGDATFEFTHKSFGEYLTVRRLVFELRLMEQQLSQHRENPDIGWDEKECLRRWAVLCGPSYLDWYLFKFLQDEIKRQLPEEAERWQDMLCDLISYMLQNGMPMHEMQPPLRYLDQLKQALHAEESLLASLSSCAWVTKKISQIEIKDKNPRMFGIWLSRLVGQRFDDMNYRVILACLNHLNLQGYSLHYRDFVNANLSYSNLQETNLALSLLREADLTGTNLSRANLSEASLFVANLSEADLTEADLTGADLNGADLNGANLYRANFNGANLNRANLIQTAFSSTNLENASLITANLLGAYLIDAYLTHADLTEAILIHADLSGANLIGADLTNADLSQANLVGADLTNADLSQANLVGADLTNADLSGANLIGADLTNAHLSGATLPEDFEWINFGI